jgi:hypothetical protein
MTAHRITDALSRLTAGGLTAIGNAPPPRRRVGLDLPKRVPVARKPGKPGTGLPWANSP